MVKEVLSEETKKGLDEVRRILYMAIVAPESGRHAAIAGTLINALLHHATPGADLSDQDFETVSSSVLATVTGRDSAWAQGLVADITALYNGETPVPAEAAV